METRANYALIGAFVLAAAVALVGFVLWLGSSQFNREYKQYDIVFPGPVVLEEGAAVRYIGITVGEVESVRIDRADPSKVRARIRVDRTTPVKSDSTAIIDFAGITGVTFVQITAGSEDAGPLLAGPDQDVPVIEAGPTPLAALFDGGAEIVAKASTGIDQLSTLLTDENIAAMSSILENVDKVTGTLAEEDEQLLAQAVSTLASLERAGDNLSEASVAVTSVASEVETELVSLNAELKTLVAELSLATGEARTTLEEGRAAMIAARELLEGPGFDTLTETSVAAQDLRVMIGRLDRVLRDIEQNPQGIVVGKRLPYEDN